MKKAISILLCAVMLCGMFAGCAQQKAESTAAISVPETVKEQSVEEPAVKVNLAVPDGVTALSIVKMIKEKPSLGKNAEITYEVVKSPDLMASKVISKEADIAIVPTNLASMLYSKNVPYKLAASNIWGVLYVASTEDIKEWKDLKGKEISNMGRGLTPDVTFRYLLSKNGLNPDTDTTLNYLSSAQELAQAMIGGKIKTAVLPEPVLTQVMTKNQNVRVVLDIQKEWARVNGIGSGYPQASLLISNELIEKNPKLVDSFLKEFSLSAQWVNQNPEKAGVMAEELGTGMNAKVIEKALERCNIRFVGAKEARGSIEAYLKVLMDFAPESVGGKLPDEKFYLQK